MNDPITKVATILFLCLGGFLAYHFISHHTSFTVDGIDPSWDAAVQSRNPSKPTVVIFTAGWCPACQGLWADVLSHSEVQDEMYHAYNVHVVDLTSPTCEVQQHSAQLGIRSIPTMIRYDANGHEQDRRHGGSEEDVFAWLKAGE